MTDEAVPATKAPKNHHKHAEKAQECRFSAEITEGPLAGRKAIWRRDDSEAPDSDNALRIINALICIALDLTCNSFNQFSQALT